MGVSLSLYLSTNKFSFHSNEIKKEKIMNTLGLNKYFMIIMLITLLAASNILSKTVTQDDKKINEFTSILKQKVLLSNDQEAKVISIMSELQSNISSNPKNKSEYIKTAQSKVEGLLDSKQKMKYDIIKNDLWKNI